MGRETIIKQDNILESILKGLLKGASLIFVIGLILGAIGGGYIGYIYGVADTVKPSGGSYSLSEEDTKLKQIVSVIMSENAELELENRRLESQYYELEKNYNNLVADWQRLTTEYGKLQQKMTVLETDLKIERMKNSNLQNNN